MHHVTLSPSLHVLNFLQTGEVILVRLICVPSLLNNEVGMTGVLSNDGDDCWCRFGIKASLIQKNA